MLHQDLGRCLVLGPWTSSERCHASQVPIDMRRQIFPGGCLRWAYRSLQASYHYGRALSGPYAPHGLRYRDAPKHRSISDPSLPRRVANRAGTVHVTSAAQSSTGSTVLLVESPAKARKLQQFLGEQYKVWQMTVVPALVSMSAMGPSSHIAWLQTLRSVLHVRKSRACMQS